MLPTHESDIFSIKLIEICSLNKIAFTSLAKEAKISRTTLMQYTNKNRDVSLRPSLTIWTKVNKALKELLNKRNKLINPNYDTVQTRWLPSSPYYNSIN